MATIDSEKLIAFEYGTFDEINGMSKQAETLYFADDKPMFYALGMWHGIDHIDGSFDSENGTLSITLTSGGANPVACTIANVGMTDEQISQLETAYTFVNSITGEDTDTIVNKWDEIVAFLNAVEGTTLQSVISVKADKTTTITAGNGLTGGGDLSANRTIALGAPSTITDSSTNSVTADSHTHAIDEASTAKRGIVQLNDNLTSDSTVQALTAKQGKTLKGLIDTETTNRKNADTKHTADIKAITDLVNLMFTPEYDESGNLISIQANAGLWTTSYLSAKSKDETASGGGIDLTAVWESLRDNADNFANWLINIAHIPMSDIVAAETFTSAVKELLTADNMPTITVSKISDFTTKVNELIKSNTEGFAKANSVATLYPYGYKTIDDDKIQDYTEVVIALIRLDDTSKRLSSGRIILARTNNILIPSYIDYTLGGQYNGTGGNDETTPLSLIGTMVNHGKGHYPAVTFQYSGVTYGGIKVYHSNAQEQVAIQKYVGNIEPFIVPYYSHKTNEDGEETGPLNSEVYDSISESNNVNVNDNIFASPVLGIGKYIAVTDSDSKTLSALALSDKNILNLGYNTTANGYSTNICGNTLSFKTGKSATERLLINSDGAAQFKYSLTVDGTLTVNSTSLFNNTLMLKKGVFIYGYDNATENAQPHNLLGLNANNTLLVGYGTKGLYPTQIYGNNCSITLNDTITINGTLGSSLYLTQGNYLGSFDSDGENVNLLTLNNANQVGIGYGKNGSNYDTFLYGKTINLETTKTNINSNLDVVGTVNIKNSYSTLKLLPYKKETTDSEGNTVITPQVYLEAADANWNNNTAEFYITGLNAARLPKFGVYADDVLFNSSYIKLIGATTISGNLSVTGSLSIGSTTDENSRVEISWDDTNKMLKLSKGMYSIGAISAKGTDDDATGSGVDLSAVWESLTTNTDPNYGSAKIHVNHIPNLTTAKITDFESGVTDILTPELTAIASDFTLLKSRVTANETSITTIKTHLKWKKVVTATA